MDHTLDSLLNIKLSSATAGAFKKAIHNEMARMGRQRHEITHLLHALEKHHAPTRRHSVHVARDVWTIATKLGLSSDIVESLTTAALLHDLGKLDIYSEILDFGGREEMLMAWHAAHPHEQPPDSIIDAVTVDELMQHVAAESSDPKLTMQNFTEWMAEKGLQRFRNKTFREYMMHHHQEKSHELLQAAGVKRKILLYVAHHHPMYLSDERRHRMPPECRIIEIADRFNAMIQSEGIRSYDKKLSALETLILLLDSLQREEHSFFPSEAKTFAKRSIAVLAQEYLPQHIVDSHLREQLHECTVTLQLGKEDHRRILEVLRITQSLLNLAHELGRILEKAIISPTLFNSLHTQATLLTQQLRKRLEAMAA